MASESHSISKANSVLLSEDVGRKNMLLKYILNELDQMSALDRFTLASLVTCTLTSMDCKENKLLSHSSKINSAHRLDIV